MGSSINVLFAIAVQPGYGSITVCRQRMVRKRSTRGFMAFLCQIGTLFANAL